MIDSQQLSAFAPILSSTYKVMAQGWNRTAPLLEGEMRLHEIQPGLYLRLANVRDCYDLHSEALLKPGLKLAWVLEGQADVSFSERRVSLGPSAEEALMVRLRQPETFQRRGRKGGIERTLTMTLTEEWLEAWSEQSELVHMDFHAWQPSRGLRLQACQMLSDIEPQPVGLARRLLLESLALRILGEALDSQAPHSVVRHGSLTHSEDRRMRRLCEMIDSGEANRLTQSDLAARLGMSCSCLQRQFLRHSGIGLGRYLREQRLDAAYSALQRGELDIAGAADSAGYASAANFATAFKRRFGISPSRLR